MMPLMGRFLAVRDTQLEPLIRSDLLKGMAKRLGKDRTVL